MALPLAAFSLLSIALTSCDNVAEEDRFVPVETTVVARRVLVQEFTGQGCTNCPLGASTIHGLQDQYPGSIISVNMHPENTQYTIPMGNIYLPSKEATVYYNYYKPSSFPAVCIDGSNPNSSISSWSNLIETALETESSADLQLFSDYDAATRKLTVTYKTNFNKVFNAPLAINLWITENGIVGPQFSGFNVLMDYVHNHVLRTTMTGEWGEEIAKSFVPDYEYTGTFNITLDESWVAENCEVVGFLQNPNSKIVEQCTEIAVVAAE